MIRTAVLLLRAVLITLAVSPPAVAEKVVLRAANGRFLRVSGDGALCAESFLASNKETFELVLRGQGTGAAGREVTLQGPGGRYFMPDPRDGHTPRLGPAGTQPADRETFQLVPVGTGRFALRPKGSKALLVFAPAAAQPADPKAPAGPALRETVEIYRVRELPAMLETALPAVIRTLAVEELAGKQYDKTQEHKTEKYIDLPAPTLKDLKRTKRRQVIGITEEYRIQAQLDGQADIRIPAMSFLANYADGGPGLILLAVDARLPVRGRVQCKVPDVVSAFDRLSDHGPAFRGSGSGRAACGQRRDVWPARGKRSARIGFSNGVFQRPAGGHAAASPPACQLRVGAQRGADPRKREPCGAKGDGFARGADPALGILAVTVKIDVLDSCGPLYDGRQLLLTIEMVTFQLVAALQSVLGGGV